VWCFRPLSEHEECLSWKGRWERSKFKDGSQAQWLIPLISATGEVEISRNLKNNQSKQGLLMGQVIEFMFSKQRALSSKPSTSKQNSRVGKRK
jgi:hypothetical protein